MRKFIIPLALAVLLTGCANSADSSESSEADSTVTAEPLTRAAQAVTQLSELSTEKHGYGQGVMLDSENRPQGALDFNSQYGKYDALALDEDSDKILLTFDQGYENGYTAKILDTLKEKNVHAVFFVLQDYAERNPELVRRMIDEGHTVGNHSVNHYSMPELSADECKSEIMGLHEYMKENFDYEMTLFRPPMGEFSEQSLAVTQKCGYKTMLWSFAYEDWDTDNQPDTLEALEKLTNAAHCGAVYLLHSVSETNAEILPELIDKLREQGFELA